MEQLPKFRNNKNIEFGPYNRKYPYDQLLQTYEPGIMFVA